MQRQDVQTQTRSGQCRLLERTVERRSVGGEPQYNEDYFVWISSQKWNSCENVRLKKTIALGNGRCASGRSKQGAQGRDGAVRQW